MAENPNATLFVSEICTMMGSRFFCVFFFLKTALLTMYDRLRLMAVASGRAGRVLARPLF